MHWAEYFFSIANVAAEKSKDRSTQVGAVIVGPNKEIRSVGFNGFPRGVNDDIDARHERPAKYLWTEHAERNAIYNAACAGIATGGCTIYQPYWPCARCARAIIQAGIAEVCIPAEDYDERTEYWSKRWGDEMKVSLEMLKEAGVYTAILFKNGEEL